MEDEVQRKVKRWTGAIGAIAACISGLVILSIQTCNEIRSAQRHAHRSERKAEAGYETLQPAIEELQNIAKESIEWANRTKEDLQDLQDTVKDLKATVQVHKEHFAQLQTKYPVLLTEEHPVSLTMDMNWDRFSRFQKPVESPKADLPADLDGAYKKQEQKK